MSQLAEAEELLTNDALALLIGVVRCRRTTGGRRSSRRWRPRCWPPRSGWAPTTSCLATCMAMGSPVVR
ncbi:hypothetical protein FMEAI12_3640040 [Parafrankia sp. Ea1.12]|nr:hypothetical protein FMEAI12_3640040 [Parafrankia sp. Ea1.12]